jgi:pyridoxamine 5'-phosphate oxidase
MNTLDSSLDPGLLDRDPLRQFQAWFAEAKAAGIVAPESVALATATADGAPSVRMVLLKHVDEDGFGFYTNLESRKAAELAANPRAALLSYWQSLGRQVRIEGRVEPAAREAAAAYFETRPFESRLAAWASPQSRPVADRAELERLVEEARARYSDGEVPLPAHWGGFLLVPVSYEFWQHGADRLHDRFRYLRDGAGWRRERLAP